MYDGKDLPEVKRAEIRYDWRYKALGVIMIGITVGCMIIFPIGVQQGWVYDYTGEVAIGLLIVALMGLTMSLEFFLTWYEVDDQGIRNHGIWHKKFDLRWEEVESIIEEPPNSSMGEYIMTIRGKNVKFKLRNLQNGLSEFAVLVCKHLPKEKYRLASRMIMYYLP